ncbi:MAG TPA: Calx-beta domain-containing protein [Candidatus Binatia bacterium]|nr:Calx-beta domain-containing protein [Candidatus Binatia bacterium]
MKHAQIFETYGRSSLTFESNPEAVGPVKFLSRGSGYSLFVTPTEAVVVLRKPRLGASCKPQTKRTGAVLRIEWVGANPEARLEGVEPLSGKTHSFPGNDPRKWRTNVPLYGKVRHQSVYPGIDLLYYGNQRQVEYDFVVAPGIDPKIIRLRFQGAEHVAIGDNGELVLTMAAGEIRQPRPFIYQEVDGGRKTVEGQYVLFGEREVGFAVGEYARNQVLVIDPILHFLGIDENCGGIAVDSAGNIFVTGTTTSVDFPTKSAFDTLLNNNGEVGPTDVFVTKLNPAASGNAQLVYSTFLGGTGDEAAAGIAVDSAGNIFVTGTTTSVDFPTKSAFDTLLNNNGEVGPTDVFVTKLNPAASGNAQLVFSTYLGGTGDETCFIAPEISSFTPTSGPIGTEVIIIGIGFSRATSVVFNATPATQFAVNSDRQIRATVPAGATVGAGKITVATPVGADVSSSDFVVTRPSVSIMASVPTASESGTTGRFTVSRTGSTANPLTVAYSILGTATNGADYTNLPGSVTIPAGSPSANITVTPINDPLNEDTETVILQIAGGAAYTVGQPSTATVQILDNDPLPVLTINNVTVLGGGTAVFTLTLSAASGRTVTANFTTSDGTATGGTVLLGCSPGADYIPQNGTRRFDPGATTQSISVSTCANSLSFSEASETFFVNITGTVNATVTSRQTRGTATIVKGPAPPRTGTFLLSPTDAAVRVHERLTYAFTWTVPEPRTWHELKALDFRIRKGKDIILWARFDEASNTFALFHEASGTFGRGVAPGSRHSLQTSEATLDMEDTSVVGSGPTGQSVTLNLSLSFKPHAAGRNYIVEVAATDDLGNRDDFVRTGTLTVTAGRSGDERGTLRDKRETR